MIEIRGHRNARTAEFDAIARIGIMDHFQAVTEGDGVENGFNVVIAVGAFACYIQAQVDFTMGENDHGMGAIYFLRLFNSSRMAMALI